MTQKLQYHPDFMYPPGETLKEKLRLRYRN